MSTNRENPYRPSSVDETTIAKHGEPEQMATPHLLFGSLAAFAVLLAPIAWHISIPAALILGPIMIRIQWVRRSGTAGPTSTLVGQILSAIGTSLSFVFASFLTFFTVCSAVGYVGGVFIFGPYGGSNESYGIMFLLGGLLIWGSIYLGLLLPFLLARSRGQFDFPSVPSDEGA